MSAVVNHAVCLGCGCLCDDIEIEVSEGAISRIDHACDLGRRWHSLQTPAIAAVDSEFAPAAVELLKTAKLPVILGIESLTTEIQRLVVQLAERIGGIVASGSCKAIVARQEVGEATATLGEIKSRADLVLFWFADPMRTHPRHLERHSSGQGRFVAQRKVVVVDERRTATCEAADEFIQCDGEREFEAIQQLRLASASTSIESSVDERWKALAERMKAANYGVIVFDPDGGSCQRCEAVFKLVRELNRHTSFVAAPLGNGGNAKGAENVIQWTTGFPSNVSLARGEASYNGDENSADWLLRRGRVDLALIVGDWDEGGLSPESASRLAELPTIRLRLASVLETAGTVFRMDGVPLPTTASLPPGGPSAEAALQSMIQAIGHRTDLAASTNA